MATRREILKTGLSGVASSLIADIAMSATSGPVGLISPVAAPVPPEATTLYPSVNFLTDNVGLARMTPDGYDQVLDRIAPTARSLVDKGAQAIALLGTSLSFYQGAAFNRELTARMTKASGKPAVTMSTAIVEGLRTVGGKRLVVATAYNDEVNRRLHTFLSEEGFTVLTMKGLGIEKIEDVNTVTQESLLKFCVELFETTPRGDTMLVSCGGLRTLELLEPLERRCKIPVVSSLPHALRAGVKLLGSTNRVSGYGKLLSL
jgi:arylmalonate decarboxylase